MNKKLIQKSSKIFLLYALVLLLCAAPIFYFVTKHLYLEDADEALILRKAEYFHYYRGKIHHDEIDNWNSLNRDNKILSWNGLKNDTLFDISYFDTLHNEIEPYRELNFPIIIDGEQYLYSSRLNLVESEDLLESIAWLFAIVVFFLLIGIYFISRRLSNTLWRPFYETLGQMEQFELDYTKAPDLSETDTEEFVRLNDSFFRLFQRTVDTYRIQKEFLENAAHELQTPLAVIQSKIDGILQLENLTKEQAIILESLNLSIAKLNRINKNLLLLSRIQENPSESYSRISLSDTLNSNIDFFNEQASQRNINVSLKVKNDVIVNATPHLVECLVNNLLMNAIKHNHDGGTVKVILINQSLTISNSGVEDALNGDKLYKRFSKQGNENSGTGLGLSIVKRITEVFGWSIKYDFSNGKHFFSIEF